MVVTLFLSFPSPLIPDTMELVPIIFSVHSGLLPVVQLLFVLADHEFVHPECITEMMTSQNESAREITAGTNASPINSVILKEPSLSASQNHLSPRTYLIVKSGENIA